MPRIRSLKKVSAGFLVFLVFFASLNSLDAHPALTARLPNTPVHDASSLVNTLVDEVPDMTPKLMYEGAEVGKVPHLSEHLEIFKRRYLGANKRLMLFDSTDALRSKYPTDEEMTRLKDALAAAAQDPANEIWIFSGQAMSVLLEYYDGIPNSVNIAAEWGAHVLYNNRKTEDSIKPYDLKTIEDLINAGLDDARDNIAGANYWPGYQYMRLVGYEPRASDHDAVQRMVDQLRDNIEKIGELSGKLSVIHNARRGYFSVQSRGMGKATLAVKLFTRRNPEFVLSVGDSPQDETMHKWVRDKGQVSVVVSSDLTQKTFAQYKLASVKEFHKFLQILPTFKTDHSDDVVNGIRKINLSEE